jgi:hypothetical protein
MYLDSTFIDGLALCSPLNAGIYKCKQASSGSCVLLQSLDQRIQTWTSRN